MARIPSYRRQKSRHGDRAFVEIGGVRRYVGAYDSPESREAYARAIAEWVSSGGHLPVAAQEITITELAARYWSHVERYYRKHGEPTSEISWLRYSLKPLLALYKDTLAKDFGPLRLKTVRDRMIKSGLSRRTVNGRTERIKRMFRWGTENELVGSGVYEALRCVAGLRKGRSEARETKPVRAVPLEDVEAVLPVVSEPVRAMIQMQLATGMRPGEVRQMRIADLDMSAAVWTYRPQRFKTQHLESEVIRWLGPRSQAILAPFLKADPNAYLFTPADVTERARHAFYQKDAYRVAIARGCKRAGVPQWTPNQLRHTSATMIREDAGLEGAQVWLGHKRASTTEIYAETSQKLACQLAAKHG